MNVSATKGVADAVSPCQQNYAYPRIYNKQSGTSLASDGTIMSQFVRTTMQLDPRSKRRQCRLNTRNEGMLLYEISCHFCTRLCYLC